MPSRPFSPPATAPAIRLQRATYSHTTDAVGLDFIVERHATGERLNAVQIPLRWGLSRSPLTAALRALEERGLIIITPRRGTCVPLPSLHEIEQMLENRELSAGLPVERYSKWDAARIHFLNGRLFVRYNRMYNELAQRLSDSMPMTMAQLISGDIKKWRASARMGRMQRQ